MEEWEQKLIIEKLDKLIETTDCNVMLLSKLEAKGTLSKIDVQRLSCIKTDMERTGVFYNLILNRQAGFKFLKEALLDTKQTGALQILKTGEIEMKMKIAVDIKDVTINKNDILGRGSYDTRVFKGKHGNIDVAVKCLYICGDLTLKKVTQELSVLETCDIHENIVRCYGSRLIDNEYQIILEFCDMTLKTWVSEKSIKILPVEILNQITVGLQWLHSQNIIHRDLKPENILLTRRLAKVKISDFGLSRRILGGMSYVATENVGTKGWVAPEMLVERRDGNTDGCHFTCASDIFSLGCVYYYVVTDGKLAFGDQFRCEGNILDGKSLLRHIDVVHCCSHILVFIDLMISSDPNARPNCTALLSCPLFWSLDRCLVYIHNLTRLDEQTIQQILSTESARQCSWDYAEEEKYRISAGFNSDKPARCLAILAYQHCKNTEGPLQQFYTLSKNSVARPSAEYGQETSDRDETLLPDRKEAEAIADESLSLIFQDYEKGMQESLIASPFADATQLQQAHTSRMLKALDNYDNNQRLKKALNVTQQGEFMKTDLQTSFEKIKEKTRNDSEKKDGSILAIQRAKKNETQLGENVQVVSSAEEIRNIHSQFFLDSAEVPKQASQYLATLPATNTSTSSNAPPIHFIVIHLSLSQISVAVPEGDNVQHLYTTPTSLYLTPDRNLKYFSNNDLEGLPKSSLIIQIGEYLSGKHDKTTRPKVKFGNKEIEVTTELLLGFLFHNLKQNVERKKQARVQGCIIIVPFWLTSFQRQQVVDAGKVAGFDETNLINENLAIAVYAHSKLADISRDICVISENSDRVDATVYSTSKLDTGQKVLEVAGHCGDYEIKTKKSREERVVHAFFAALNNYLVIKSLIGNTNKKRKMLFCLSHESLEWKQRLVMVKIRLGKLGIAYEDCWKNGIILQGACIHSKYMKNCITTVMEMISGKYFSKVKLTENWMKCVVLFFKNIQDRDISKEIITKALPTDAKEVFFCQSDDYDGKIFQIGKLEILGDVTEKQKLRLKMYFDHNNIVSFVGFNGESNPTTEDTDPCQRVWTSSNLKLDEVNELRAIIYAKDFIISPKTPTYSPKTSISKPNLIQELIQKFNGMVTQINNGEGNFHSDVVRSIALDQITMSVVNLTESVNASGIKSQQAFYDNLLQKYFSG